MISGASSRDHATSFAAAWQIRVSVTASVVSSSSAATSEAAASTPQDTVQLSPAAVAASKDGDTPAADVTEAGTPSSLHEQRAQTLLDALDTDQDGALTEEEFVRGARALLRGAARARHADHETSGPERHGHGHGFGRRLERRLERAFDRIDADGDGSLTKAELTAALGRLARPSGETAGTADPAATPATETAGDAAPAAAASSPATDQTVAAPISQKPAATDADQAATPGGPAPQTAPATGSYFAYSMTTVTFVAVAVQRYQNVSQLGA